jgi:hypothetical protein
MTNSKEQVLNKEILGPINVPTTGGLSLGSLILQNNRPDPQSRNKPFIGRQIEAALTDTKRDPLHSIHPCLSATKRILECFHNYASHKVTLT